MKRTISLTFAIFATILLIALVGCEGPTGPAGPQGEPGAVSHVVFATADHRGEAMASLPSGTLEGPPALTCYVREPGDLGWIAVATSRDHVCALLGRDGGLLAAVAGLTEGWEVLFVAVY